ncbi:MFS transporter [Allobranchiibius huperziae]|uniref:Putative MFS family arabinose efflux permease n=1 Tax=Allobranchiibius huperziae TaxID=1874116 RepID=A0A853D7Z5_9MICO|nr:MFS transporter [Allobranchiibius huperziae]NYJ73068.1 putative MFS family arabinose efflux permease [Allobranchiibius huperziae]
MSTDGQPGPLHRNHAFMVLLLGQTASSIGSSMTGLVFPLIGYALTGSTLLAGVAATSVLVGELAGRLVSGALVDRWAKRRVIVLANLTAALAVASLAAAELLGHLVLAHLMIAGLVLGLADSFLAPASSASVRQVVPPEQLPLAYTRLQARDHVASLVGPPLGGALYSIARSVPFVVDTVSYLAYAAGASRLRTDLRSDAPTGNSLLTDARAGVHFVWHHHVVRSVLLWGGLFNFAMAYVFTAVTLRLVRAGVTPAAIGLVDTCAAAAGLLGAVIAPTIVARFRSGLLTIVTGLALALLVAPMGLTINVVVTGALFAAGFLLLPANNSAISAYISNATPQHLQARVNAASGLVALGFAPLAPPVAGVLIIALGDVGSMLAGSVFLFLSLVPLLTDREVVALGRPDTWRPAP